jgi:hypothetical protein
MSNEKIENEIANAARVLDMEIEEVKKKYDSICETNDLTSADDWKLALSLFRQWFSGTRAYSDAPARESTGTNSLVKTANGFFISIDAARDMAAMQNERIKNEYMRDPDTTYEIGRIARATMNDMGTYDVSRMYEGEEQTRAAKELPKNNFEIESGEWIIPLDNLSAYASGPNPNYGKPLPHEQFRMAGVFIGDIEEDVGVYYFSYKGEASKSFNPKTFTSLTMQVIRDQTNTNRIYGFKQGTLESLEIDDRQPEIHNYQNGIGELCSDNCSELIDLNRYHTTAAGKSYAERFVVTDGSVSSVNMTPNAYGTRRVTITDLNSDFDYEGGSWAGTTCWFPSHVDIDFGIGSSIIVVGRTSQGRNEDGSVGDVTLNVSGVLVAENRGQIVEPFQVEEEDLDWF